MTGTITPFAKNAGWADGFRAEVREAFAAGLPAVFLDEGGALLAFPAATATTAQLHFAISHSSGIVHAAMPSSLLDRLRIPDQPILASENSGASFTVAVDAASGIGTGISARDRAHTMRVLADPGTVADDVTRPGHILPVRCADGGFTERGRAWERAVDLSRAAGHPPVVVMCRLVDDAGEILDGLTATLFALNHQLALSAGTSGIDTRPDGVRATRTN
ncbi:3,4-dihydroxy-2-butanone-4-phosphate synthase [Mycobacterium sp. 141]|uniref:3,4-dihydroxy-2-butanone-4-phosphate synthase n=1 Tax=Mycobacterium sp. 141 TaxID=1120797 RepID=UPI0003684094|nr:3,4-dihydroxy-2-butanone-4-phosphate synthase [Mycobacterium sp. 141]